MNDPHKVINDLLSAKEHIQIKLLGDSVTHGLGGVGFEQDGEPICAGYARNPNGYCWANSFAEYMKQKYGATVVNNACCGADLQFLIDNFDVLVDDSDDLIICDIGSNNCQFYCQLGPKPTREAHGAEIYGYIKQLYTMIHNLGKEVIFIADIPMCPSREGDGPTWWQILNMGDINAIYKAAAESFGFPLISMYDNFREYCDTNKVELDSLYWDGLHPNDRGYDVMFDYIISDLKLK
ncbi:MAG: SGNH/GDSL hydrolase family protein [Clostridia bacterium]|nr:SGNH/GDSL hydrolase family protein [Clostridia bacterium]